MSGYLRSKRWMWQRHCLRPPPWPNAKCPLHQVGPHLHHATHKHGQGEEQAEAQHQAQQGPHSIIKLVVLIGCCGEGRAPLRPELLLPRGALCCAQGTQSGFPGSTEAHDIAINGSLQGEEPTGVVLLCGARWRQSVTTC